MCARNGSAKEVAQCHGVFGVTLYQWGKQLLGEEQSITMQKKSTSPNETTDGRTDPTIQKLLAEKSILGKQVASKDADYIDRRTIILYDIL